MLVEMFFFSFKVVSLEVSCHGSYEQDIADHVIETSI